MKETLNDYIPIILFIIFNLCLIWVKYYFNIDWFFITLPLQWVILSLLYFALSFRTMNYLIAIYYPMAVIFGYMVFAHFYF